MKRGLKIIGRYKTKHLRDQDTLEHRRKLVRERQHRWSRANGSRAINFRCDIETAGSLLYLKKQWGFKTSTEAVMASLCFLMVVTRLGLKTLDTRVYDAIVRLEQEKEDR
jgi:hypothetical protein